MFELSTVDVATEDATAHEQSGVCVRQWTGTTGAIRARAYVGPAWNWIVWDGVATFRFRRDANTIEALPAQGANPATVKDLYRRHILPLVMQARGLEAIHASAVMSDRGVLAFCGEGGTGKSTIAYALSRRGYPQYADDVLVMEPTHGRVDALSLPFAPRLRPETARFFSNDIWTHLASDFRSHSERNPIAALFVLEGADAARTGPEIRRCSGVEALTTLLSHAQRFDLLNLASRKRHLQNYLEITAVVPVFSARFVYGFEQIDALLDGLIHAAEVGCPQLCEAR